MEYDENQKKIEKNLRHHLGKYCVFLRHCAIYAQCLEGWERFWEKSPLCRNILRV